MTTTTYKAQIDVDSSETPGIWYFYFLLLSQFISQTGAGLTRFALGVWIYQGTGSATQFALNSLAATVPFIAVSPFAGAIVDRYKRQWVMMISTAGAALSTLALALFLFYGKLEVWHVYLATAVSAIFSSLQNPAFFASVPGLVARKDLGRASALAQLCAGVAQIISPVLAGALIAAIHIYGVLFVDGATCLIAIVCLLIVRLPSHQTSPETTGKKTLLRDSAQGWNYLFQRPGLLQLLVLFGVVNFFMGIVLALSTPMILSTFRPAILGSVLTIGGLGALGGSLSMNWFGRPGRRVLRVLLFSALCGLFIGLAGFKPSFLLLASAAFGIFYSLEVVNGCSIVIIQSKVPSHMQGRIFSISSLIATSTMPLAYLMAGPLADQIFEPLMATQGKLATYLGPFFGVGPGRGIGVLFTLMGLLTILTQVMGLLYPRLRLLDLELPDETSDRPEPVGPIRNSHPQKEIPSPFQFTAMNLFPGHSPQRIQLIALCSVAVILSLSLGAGYFSLRPPKAQPLDFTVTDFSAERALQHLKVIARAPHPIGSAEHTEVRNYLVSKLTELGLSPEVMTSQSVIRKFGNQFAVGDVRNIVARIPGTASTKSVVLVGHYDSTPTGPGASDDGAAIAAILETIRALKTGPPLQNDVIVLFTDGEEIGLLGAQAFAEENPLAKTVGLILNFEARGSSGLSLMFETTSQNGKLVREFARAARYPATSSLFQEVYKLLPNSTDLAAFKDAKLNGLNFAFIDHSVDYHSEQDTPDKIDLRSLQQHGYYALDLTRHFGNLNLNTVQENDTVFFSLFNSWVVVYPQSWVLPLAILSGVFLVFVLRYGYRKSLITWKGVAVSFLFLVAGGFGVSVIVALYWWFLGAIRVVSTPATFNDSYNLWVYLLGFIFLGVGVYVQLCRTLVKKVNVFEAYTSVLLAWGLLAILTSFLLPGASYLFIWPLFLQVGGWWLVFSQSSNPKRIVLVNSLAALPGMLLFLPLLYLLLIGLSLEFSWVLMPFLWLVISLITPQLFFLTEKTRKLGMQAALLASLVLVLCAALINRYDVHHKYPNSVFYAFNQDTGKSVWASTDDEPDQWTAQFFGKNPRFQPLSDFFPASEAHFMQNDAPPVALPPPTAEILDDTIQNNQHITKIRLRSARNAALVQLGIELGEGLTKCRLNGKELDLRSLMTTPSEKWLVLRYWAFPKEGAEFTFETKIGGHTTLHVVDQTFGFPTFLNTQFQARPQNAMSIPFGFGFTDRTLVGKTFRY